MISCDAIILAGGFGTRLASVVSDRPKVLADIDGRPFIEILLDSLADNGFQRVILAVGFKADLIQSVLGESYRGMKIIYSSESYPLGTGGSMAAASFLAEGEIVSVMNGDSWCKIDHSSVLQDFEKGLCNIALAIAHVPDASRFGMVECDKEGFISRFGEKEVTGRPGWVNAGVYYFRRSVLEWLRRFPTPCSFEVEVLPSLLQSKIRAIPSQGEFIDIGIPESYYSAPSFFQRNVAQRGK